MKNAYQKVGVDVEAGYDVVARIKKHVEKTNRIGVMGSLGGFGGCFDLSQFDVKEPVLVSGTDGVGTKLMLAIQSGQHDTIGIDCVAMCVNDILAQGAEPLFFLDYLATGKTKPEQIEEIVKGVATGCEVSGMALIGGETAEMPDMYNETDYDLAGFAVGLAEKKDLITGQTIQKGDILLGLPSSGLHSNGFSLVRDIFFKQHDYHLDTQLPELSGKTLQQELLTPTKIYVQDVMALIRKGKIKGMSHITGGGFNENIPRMLPDTVSGVIRLNTWPVLPIFDCLQSEGHIPDMEMFDIFNMGIGMVLAVSASDVPSILTYFESIQSPCYEIGYVTDRADKPLLIEPSV
ncbi:MAG: phosphoribosylformylglycinamidine cyclo-ligase [Vagococcus sp.]